MEFQISGKLKKVIFGLMGVGLVLLIAGFFTQKDYAFPTVIDDHTLVVEYWRGASEEQQNALKEEMIAEIEALGFTAEVHDLMEGHEDHGHGHAEGDHDHAEHEGGEEDHGEGHDEHGEHEEHHEVPTFVWKVDIHQKAGAEDTHEEHEGGHAEGGHGDHGHGHGDATAPAEVIAAKFECGSLSMSDSTFRRFWSNLLVNGFFFMGIALGALFYLALHYATESGWGVVLLRVMEGVSSALPLGMVALLIVFLAATFGMNHIYPWMDADVVAHDDLVYFKGGYLNKPFFWIRIIAYFAVFLYFMRWFRKTSQREDVEGGTVLHYLMYRRSALFLVFFAVFSSTMSWDIIMSIDVHWFSTLFGWYVFSGIWLSAMVMIMMVTLYLKSQGYLEFVNSSHIHDVGKWMFALSFLWSYLWFSQFMLIWYANIPEEVIYYVTRIESYKFVFFGMFVLNFVLPMIFFMSADTKKSWPYLIVIGLIIFVAHWFDVFCMVMPGTLFEEWNFGILEIGMFMLFLGGFMLLMFKGLASASLVQKNHPYLEESKHHHG